MVKEIKAWIISCLIEKDVRNPRAENLLVAFPLMVFGETILSDGNCYGFVSELTDLQKDILAILGIPPEYYTYEYLFDTAQN